MWIKCTITHYTVYIACIVAMCVKMTCIEQQNNNQCLAIFLASMIRRRFLNDLEDIFCMLKNKDISNS